LVSGETLVSIESSASCEAEACGKGTSTRNQKTMTAATEIPIALDRFIQSCGITDTTAWRWRKKNWLTTTNIAGRLYIMPQDLREFNRRATAGEFAQEHKTPKREPLERESVVIRMERSNSFAE
jgi:hypothetical protein